MADFSGSGALAGAVQGGAQGAQTGNPYAALGLAAGGAITGGSSGTNDKGPQLPWDQYNARLADIADYQNQLTGAQSSWSNAISNYNTTMMSLTAPNIIAANGANGLSINSGAVGAEIARQAAAYQAQGTTQIAQQNFKNINAVDQAKGQAWGDMFGAEEKANQLGWGSTNQNKAAVGNMVMSGIGTLASNWGKMSGPTGTTSTAYFNPFASNDGGGSLSPSNIPQGAVSGDFLLQ